ARQDQVGGEDNEAVTKQLDQARELEARTWQLNEVNSRAVIVQDGVNGDVAHITQDGGSNNFARIDQQP
ncbi:MAG: hypothetical protein ACLFTE_09975, partial [Salinivenus sp.]